MAQSTPNTVFYSKLANSVVTELKAFGSQSMTASTWSTVTDGTTNASVTITPTKTTSKVLITGCLNFFVAGTAGGSQMYFKLQRNGVDIKVGDAGAGQVQATWVTNGRNGGSTSTAPLYSIGIFLLDAPASTSALTYTLQAYTAGSAPTAITLYVNEGTVNTDVNTNAVSYSQLAATEVLA